MAINKVTYGGSTLIDLTASTVTADSMLSGVTALDKSGQKVTGNVVIQRYHTGSSTPASSFGNDGDLYLKVV